MNRLVNKDIKFWNDCVKQKLPRISSLGATTFFKPDGGLIIFEGDNYVFHELNPLESIVK